MGPISPPSFPEANKYILVFVDDYKRFVKSCSIQHKRGAGDCLADYIKYTRNLIGKNEKFCFLQADNAIKCIGREFNKILEKEAAIKGRKVQ